MGYVHEEEKWWWSIMMWVLQMLQTNCYVLYVKYMRLHRKQPLSHFTFNQQICMAWMNPMLYWPKKKRDYISTTSTDDLSSITTRSQNKSPPIIRRAPKMTDIALDPHTGKLRCRLTNNVHHWPVQNTKRDAACQMHRWAVGGKKKKKH